MDRETVKVYVRAGGHKGERSISLQPPKEIPQSEWLDRGFAFDGNSVIASVTATTYVNRPGVSVEEKLAPEKAWITDFQRGPGGLLPGEWAINWSLTKALADVQHWLVEWLDTLGYDVEFA